MKTWKRWLAGILVVLSCWQLWAASFSVAAVKVCFTGWENLLHIPVEHFFLTPVGAVPTLGVFTGLRYGKPVAKNSSVNKKGAKGWTCTLEYAPDGVSFDTIGPKTYLETDLGSSYRLRYRGELDEEAEEIILRVVRELYGGREIDTYWQLLFELYRYKGKYFLFMYVHKREGNFEKLYDLHDGKFRLLMNCPKTGFCEAFYF